MQPYQEENGLYTKENEWQEGSSYTMQPYEEKNGFYTKENGCQEGSSYAMQLDHKDNGLYTKENGLWGVNFRQFLPEIAEKRHELSPATPQQVFKTKICPSFAATRECMFGNDCPDAHMVFGLDRVPSIFNNAIRSTQPAISCPCSENRYYHLVWDVLPSNHWSV